MRTVDCSYGRFTRTSYPNQGLTVERELSSAYRTLHVRGRLVAELVHRRGIFELSRARTTYGGAGRSVSLRCAIVAQTEEDAERRAVQTVFDNPDDFL